MKKQDSASSQRKSDYPISSFILNRWSPRAMTGEPISKDELFSLFEAARWAPSSFNNQPWIFIYGMRGTEAWNTLHELLVPFNHEWTSTSSALILVASRNNFYQNDKPSVTHSFDTGAAWMALALEGHEKGLVVHGMQGFDYEAAKKKLNIPKDYTVEAMIAVGKPAPKETLSKELQAKEVVSTRRPITDFVMEGSFKKSGRP
jgi:nitroreductase